jgi:YidC/Oxa1 family membrane protein insertase
MEERRLLTALALSLLVYTAYSYLFPPPRRNAAPVVAAKASPGSGPGAEARPIAESGSGPGPLPASSAVAPASAPAVADERERRVEVETHEMTVAFSNRGARLVSWQLKLYPDARGRPEEMVEAPRGGPRPLDLETGDSGVDERLREALFRPSADTLTVGGPGPKTLRFEYRDGAIAADKELTFDARGFLVSLTASVHRDGRELPLKLLWGPGLGNPSAEDQKVQGYLAAQGVALAAGSVERLAAEKLSSPRMFSGLRFIGLESHYFAALFVPPGPGRAGELRAVALPAAEEGKTPVAALAAIDLGPGAAPALLYVGPKDYHQMKALGHDLVQVVPVGDWIGPITVFLLSVLRFVHGYVGNYGWSIVALTVLINLVMAPFRHYSIANSVKMAKISPEMKVIQERYRKVPLLDPKRQDMNEEMSRLYARHGMNMSTQMTMGCLPMLITLPFLFAFYNVLRVTIDLKGAPFLWISDLSHKDPLFIIPVLMGASMFLTQKITPNAMDPAQQRMMMMMPIVFTAMFFAAPAGLSLYWLASNLCGIVQQAVTINVLRSKGEAVSVREKGKKR